MRDALLATAERLCAFERGSATPGEGAAAAWIAEQLRERGLATEVEQERAHGGFWWPIGLANGAAVLAAAAPWGPVRRGVAVAVVALLADDLDHRRRLLRRLLPHRPTWNVTARAGDPAAARTLLVVAHHDTAHGGFIFDTRLIELLARRLPRVHARMKRWPPVMWGVVIGPLLVALGARRLGAVWSAGAAATMADIGRRPAVPGANDNASAVAVLLELAPRLPPDLRVLLLSTGSEESLSEGMQAWVRRHAGELDPARTAVVALETLGSGHLVLAESEGFLWPHAYDAGLRDLAAACAAQEGIELWRGLSNAFASDGQIALHAGLRTILLGGLDDLKLPKNYHKPWDRPEGLELGAMEDAVRLLAAFARAWAEDDPPSARSR